jgi:hypothetical protein
MKMIARVGDYYYSLRMRPDKRAATYEYFPNKRYSYKDVKRTLAQINIHVTASRYWSDLALSTLEDHQLHPYFEWCPGNSLELHLMDAECGLGHLPIGSEIIYRQQLPESGKGRKPLVDHASTVSRLFKLGVMDSESRDTLFKLKAIIDERIEKAMKEQERSPFAIAHRMIQIFINRWKLVSKSLDHVANPHNPHGPRVYNADVETDDRKRKADTSSLTVSTPSAASAAEDDGETTDENDDVDAPMVQQDQQAAHDNQDRQNPVGSGGNPV